MIKLQPAHYWDAEHKNVSVADLKGRITALETVLEWSEAKPLQLCAWREELQWRKTQLAKLGGQ